VLNLCLFGYQTQDPLSGVIEKSASIMRECAFSHVFLHFCKKRFLAFSQRGNKIEQDREEFTFTIRD